MICRRRKRRPRQRKIKRLRAKKSERKTRVVLRELATRTEPVSGTTFHTR